MSRWWLPLLVFPTLAAAPKAHDEASPAEVHWAYDGEAGPAHWAELSPAFERCGVGRSQTPIDLDSRYADTVGLDDVVFHYHPGAPKVVDNGHTVQVNVPTGNAIELDGASYDLAQFHLHSPSEHRLNGKSYDLELHLVHKDAGGNLAVVALLLQPGAANKTLTPIFSAMAAKPGQEKGIESEVNLADLLPEGAAVMRYEGSLTTPPCTEGVRWIVVTTPITASAEQIAAFRKRYDHNSRPIQALNGRPVLLDATP